MGVQGDNLWGEQRVRHIHWHCTVHLKIPQKRLALMSGCCTCLWVCVCVIYQRRKCTVDPSAPRPRLWLTEKVRNSCVMWGAAVILYVCVCVCAYIQAQTCKDSINRCLEHNLWYPTFRHKAEPAPPFPHAPHPKLLRLPNTLIASSIYTNRPIVKH